MSPDPSRSVLKGAVARLPFWSASVLAALVLVIGVATRLGLSEYLQQRATFIFFVPAVVAAAALSGFGAGVMVSAVGAAAVLHAMR